VLIKKIKKNKIKIFFILVLIFAFGYNFYQLINDIKNMKNMGAQDIVDAMSFFAFWKNIMTNEFAIYIILISPVLITIAAVSDFFNEYHTGFFQNVLIKKKYSTYIKENIYKSWLKGGLIIPFISIIIIMISYILYPISTIMKSDYSILYFCDAFIKSPYLGFIFSTINMFLFGVLAINIGIILTKYVKHFVLMIIATFLSFVGISIFSEVVLGGIFAYNLNDKNIMNSFSIYNSWKLDDVQNLWLNSVVLIFYILLTLYLIFKIFKNKEKIILNYE